MQKQHTSVAGVSAVKGASDTGALNNDAVNVRNGRARLWAFIAIVIAACSVGWFAATVLPVTVAGAAALTVFCISLWATGIVPEYWTAFAFFLLAVSFQLAPAEIVFSGFHSSTFWLLFSGVVLGGAIQYTGLGERIAKLLSGYLGTTYLSVLCGIAVFGMGLAFVMPSALGRVVLLIPLTTALAQHMGYKEGTNGRVGMLQAAVFSTCLPAFAILPANVPNMMLAGMAETIYGHQITYWEYLALHFPVVGFVKATVLVLLIRRLFPAPAPEGVFPVQHASSPVTAAEQRLGIVLAVSLALWLTDSVHHIAPGWVALSGALYCLWPQSGVLPSKALNSMNHSPLFFVAAIMGLGAVISVTGLGEAVVQALSAHAGFTAGEPYQNVAILTGISTLVAIVTNLPGVPAVMTPVAGELAALTGLPLPTVLMTEVLAFSNVFLPYQAPPLIIAMQLAGLPFGATARLCLLLFGITAFVLTPLSIVWWSLLGFL